jgi:hypothetical protein
MRDVEVTELIATERAWRRLVASLGSAKMWLRLRSRTTTWPLHGGADHALTRL